MSDCSADGSVPVKQRTEQKKDQDIGKKDIQVVEFVLGNEHFAIDLFDVREVVEYTNITKLPNSPPYIKGIIDLRGEITTIIDLKQRLDVKDLQRMEEQNSRIIVLDENITQSKIGIIKKKIRIKEKDINELIIWIDIKPLIHDINL